eukprot:3076970-Pyramimonas_sp.AAC.1
MPRAVPQSRRRRNLGHELHGQRALRKVEKKGLQAVRERKHRLLMLRRAVGRKAPTLWRTGLMLRRLDLGWARVTKPPAKGLDSAP